MFYVFQCLGTTGTVGGIDEDHDIVVTYPSGNRLVLSASWDYRISLIPFCPTPWGDIEMLGVRPCVRS